jgi:hypothetical protein
MPPCKAFTCYDPLAASKLLNFGTGLAVVFLIVFQLVVLALGLLEACG